MSNEERNQDRSLHDTNIDHTSEDKNDESKTANGQRVRMHCVIGCLFAITTWIGSYVQIFFVITNDTALWVSPVASLIVIWKATELYDSYWQWEHEPWFTHYTNGTMGILLRSMVALHGALCYLICCVLGEVTYQEDHYYSGRYNLNLRILGTIGMGTLLVISMIEQVFCCVWCSKGNIASKKKGSVWQVLIFFWLLMSIHIDPLFIFFGYYFFVWEGINLCNKFDPKVLPYWNAFFKVLTTISFWVASWNSSTTFGYGLKDGPLPLLASPVLFCFTCATFDSQAFCCSGSSNNNQLHQPLGKWGEKGFIYVFLPVSYFAIMMSNEATVGVFLISTISALILWALVRDYIPVKYDSADVIEPVRGDPVPNDAEPDPSVQTTRSADGSVFKHASALFYVMACIVLLIYSVLLSRGMDSDANKENENWLAILMIACGCCFFIHTLCWIKVKFHFEGAEEGDEFNLPEDTYTMLMCNDEAFSLSWLLSMLVFVVQIVLITMIIATQFQLDERPQQDEGRGPYLLDVPYDVIAFTRIGQFAGMMIILFYQKDFWIASTLLDIRWIGGPQRDHSILFPNTIRMLQAMGVIFASTVLILQSEDIINLVKDYTAILFISEIDDYLFWLASHGYLGPCLKNSSTKCTNEKYKKLNDVKDHPIRGIGLMTNLSLMIAFWAYVLTNQMNGSFFQKANGDCYYKLEEVARGEKPTILDYGNGHCDQAFNFPECQFDGGDCLISNLIKEGYIKLILPKCTVPWNSFIGNGRCDGGVYNTLECNWDDGDCELFNANYPNCNVDNPYWIGDGICDGEVYDTEACGRDGGDCP